MQKFLWQHCSNKSSNNAMIKVYWYIVKLWKIISINIMKIFWKRYLIKGNEICGHHCLPQKKLYSNFNFHNKQNEIVLFCFVQINICFIYLSSDDSKGYHSFLQEIFPIRTIIKFCNWSWTSLKIPLQLVQLLNDGQMSEWWFTSS